MRFAALQLETLQNPPVDMIGAHPCVRAISPASIIFNVRAGDTHIIGPFDQLYLGIAAEARYEIVEVFSKTPAVAIAAPTKDA